MTDVAFFAPLKPPTHPVPSGDREMARNLMGAIGQGLPNGQVRLVSDLRLHETVGDVGRQDDLMRAAQAECTRLVAELRANPVALWVTYHNYYKAPDLLGPRVCATLGIPYVIVEASRARSRLSGPWAGFAAAAEAASDAAEVIYYMTAHDLLTLSRDKTATQSLALLRPFLPLDTLPPAAPLDSATMLSVGMMRAGDKLASYTLIAETLALMRHPDWALEIAGDGPARDDVAALMRPFGDRVRFLGQLDRPALADAQARAALMLWPGVNEAYGMVYLEAQAAGLPVVAQDRPGVRDVLAGPPRPDPSDGAAGLAHLADALLGDTTRRKAEGAAARAHMAERHLRAPATTTFWHHATPLLNLSEAP